MPFLWVRRGQAKHHLVEGLASKIVAGDAPELIANKVIYSVSLSSMVAGTEYRGQFEKRLEDFVNEAKKYTNLILFIDEVHTLIGAGGATNNSLEASNILKPELARGTISCIGATTVNEYTNTIKKDTALDRRFERVIIREPSKFQMEEILPTIVSYYEDFHGVEYSDNFLNNIIDYCEKYIPNKFYPDKAIDIIDHCGAQAKVSFWHLSPP
jgi:ATP-dependent Clp protease ATP-binding subunit ClpA